MYPWGDARPYHSYAAYCRRTFGRPIQKLPVDGGFTCPNRDGTVGHGGCSFCSNEAFTPAYCDPRRTVRQQVDDAIAFHRRGFPAGTGFLVYFQSYSNTYAPLERLQRLFGEALACPGVAGIVVGTRPDCVDAAKLDYLADLARRTYVCVEYGIESTSDATLRTIDRGHDFAAARRAVEATAARGVAVGAHFILGLPDESDTELLDRTRIINALPLATVKFHQLQFVEGTRMTDLYDAEPARFAACGPTSPSNASRARHRPASAAGGRGATCAVMRCGGCSKKDSSKKTRIRANFSYLRSVNRSLS